MVCKLTLESGVLGFCYRCRQRDGFFNLVLYMVTTGIVSGGSPLGSIVLFQMISGDTAMDQRTGDPFVFDACSIYGHNDYDTGNWRALRHRLSDKTCIERIQIPNAGITL